jgi:hypothetical protein
MFQVPSEDFHVGQFAAGKRTVNPHNVAWFECRYGNLIALSVGTFFTNGHGLLDSEIGTIDGDLLQVVFLDLYEASVLPLDI